jgi:hypothetical protein
VVQVDVDGRYDETRVLVLYLCQVIDEPSLIMLIKKRNDPQAYPADLVHPLIMNDGVPYGIPYSLRARRVTTLFCDLVKPTQKTFREGYACAH